MISYIDVQIRMLEWAAGQSISWALEDRTLRTEDVQAACIVEVIVF